MITDIRRRLLGLALSLGSGFGILVTTPVHAATVTINGPTDCWGLKGYPALTYNATQVRIKTIYENRWKNVDLFGRYSVTMFNVPTGGIDARATITCQSADTWDIPFRLTPTTTQIDLTKPTPANISVSVLDPTNNQAVWWPTPPIAARQSWKFTVEIYNANNV